MNAVLRKVERLLRRVIGENVTLTLNLRTPVHRVVIRIFASWNQLDGWLRQVEGLMRVA